MQITRTRKSILSANSSDKDKYKKNKITQKLSDVMLDILASFLISENRNIRKKGYSNIQTLMNLLDERQYTTDVEIEKLEFIKLGLEARLQYNLLKKEQVIDFIKCHSAEERIFNINFRELSNDDVEYINKQVTDILDTAEFESKILTFEGLATEYKNSTPYHKREIVAEWKNLIQYWANQIRLNKVEEAEDDIVSLKSGVFEDYAHFVHNDMTNPSSKLSTGMVGFNYLLNDGFESGRVYCLFGLQGEGKSTTLLNLALQMKHYNRSYKPKDPTKTPAIVYLTLENTKKETFNRMFSISTDEASMANYDVDECIDMMRSQGLVVSDENPIDVIVKYKANNSIDTSYLYEINDNLADMGYEVIGFVIDYLNLIRSINRFAVSEERLKLGSVVNELKAIAAELDIPIITASQFNRDANAKIDEAREKGSNSNTVLLLGRSNIGESMLILNNLDGCYMITPEYINGGQNKYLGIKLGKARYKPNTKALNGQNSVHIPYTRADGIKLACDVGLKEPLYKLDLTEAKLDVDGGGVIVDDKVKLPNNNSRCKEDNEIIPRVSVKKTRKKNNKSAEGYGVDDMISSNELEYNPNWRDLPKYKSIPGVSDKILNVDALPPEQQIRLKRSINNNKKLPERLEIDGPSRYTDEYTLLYDPDGSKEERLAYDYNLMYGKNFNESHFSILLTHLNRVKQGEISENVLELTPFCRVGDRQHSQVLFKRVD